MKAICTPLCACKHTEGLTSDQCLTAHFQQTAQAVVECFDHTAQAADCLFAVVTYRPYTTKDKKPGLAVNMSQNNYTFMHRGDMMKWAMRKMDHAVDADWIVDVYRQKPSAANEFARFSEDVTRAFRECQFGVLTEVRVYKFSQE